MYLIIDFGIIRSANKAKKKLWEINPKNRRYIKDTNNRVDRYNLRDSLQSSTYDNTNINSSGAIVFSFLETEDGLRSMIRGSNRKGSRYRENTIAPHVIRKYKSGEQMRSRGKKVALPDTKNYTDIRSTKDVAASSTGYTGFHVSPSHPNYMTEGEVPLIGKKVVKTNKPRLQY